MSAAVGGVARVRVPRLNGNGAGGSAGCDLATDDAACADLVRRVRAGDPDGFRLLYVAYHERIDIYLRVLLQNRDDAQEVTQQVFLRAFEKIDTFRLAGEPFGAWLFGIARNAGIDHVRKSSRTDVESPTEIDRRRDRATRDNEISEGLDPDTRQQLESLPPTQRQVMVMRYLFGLSAAEMGHVLGCSADSVRHFQQRALKTLRTQIAPVLVAVALVAKEELPDRVQALVGAIPG